MLRVSIFWCFLALIITLSGHATASWEEEQSTVSAMGHLEKRDERKSIISTENGDVSAVTVRDGNQSYHLHFITMEPNSLFLPVLLHSDMLFYVHTGSGRLSYQDDDDDDEMEDMELRRGDVFRLRSGTVFFLQRDLDPVRHKLRIIAIFGNSGSEFAKPTSGPYSSIRDIILGFHKKVLQETFKVPEEVVEELINGTKPPAIMHGLPNTQKTTWQMFQSEYRFGVANLFEMPNKKKKSKLFNIFSGKPDFENCNGWSTTVNNKKDSALRDSKFGFFMVNLTTGSMTGPHWNPKATEIAIVLQGKGMVRVVCPKIANETACLNARFGVEEGDVFVVPRFHPMAQMAFNNETFVFMGFSTSTKKNHPQYLAGKASVLRTLDKHILATSFGVTDKTFDRLLAQQGDSVILDCISCAEEEWRIMEEEIEKERQDVREREEQEAKQREERRREEEEARREEEEEKKREQEEREARQREEEEVQRRKEQEEQREREERQRREQEEREAQQREAEEAQRRREQEEREREEQRQREQEEREAQQRAEEAARREQEEAEGRQREQEQEQEEREAQQREAEEAQSRREQEERERKEQKQREQEEREEKQRAEEAARKEREEAEGRQREQEQAREAERQRSRSKAKRASKRGRETERSRSKKGAGRSGSTRSSSEQEEAEGRQREQEQAREAERHREAEARREQEEAAQQEAATERREQQGREGGQGGGGGQQVEGRQAPGEEGAAGRGEAEIGENEEGRSKGWGRRILKKTT